MCNDCLHNTESVKESENTGIHIQDPDKDDMRYGKKRDQYGEFRLSGLVMKKLHADKASYAATEDGHQDKSLFGYPEGSVYGFFLIYAIKKQSHEIYKNIVKKKYCCQIIQLPVSRS